jgi:hypothetical protein
MDNDPLSVARFGANIARRAVADARNAGFRRRWPGAAERDITRALRRDLGRPGAGFISRPAAGLAQLVEHLICNQGVTGSNPVAGTKRKGLKATKVQRIVHEHSS